MSGKNQNVIRELLLRHSDGLTTPQIQSLIGKSRNFVHMALRAMPDAYIDRWTISEANRGQFEAVWCVVIPPENCPHPRGENE
jgi:hypothetical protein